MAAMTRMSGTSDHDVLKQLMLQSELLQKQHIDVRDTEAECIPAL